MGIMNHLAQSPAMQQMAEQLSGQMDETGSDQRAPHRSRPREDGPPPDFGSFLQQMLPAMGQASAASLHLLVCIAHAPPATFMPA